MSKLRTWFAAAGLLAAAVVAPATTVVPPEFPELVHSSDFIVRGRVRALRNEIRVREGREIPFTHVEIEVRELVAGTAPARVVLTLLGGRTSDGGELVVEGAPKFTVGDEDILFVQGNGRNFHPLNAVMHGRYPVKFDKALKREYVARANGVPLLATAEVALPLAEGKIAALLRHQVKADDALTPAEFIQSIKETRAARFPGGANRAK